MASGWDFDGVLSTGHYMPKTGDVVVTGRCVDEAVS